MDKRKLEMVIAASKCEGCVTKPCQIGCPLSNDIPSFIKAFKKNDLKEAFNILSKTTVLPAICGKICPYEKQCQGSCAKKVSYDPVEIGKIESYIGDVAIEEGFRFSKKNAKNKKIAVIGSGPSSLSCAGFLSREGYQVTIYEKHDYLGGLLYHGIPDFRLDKNLLKKAIDQILDLGIEVKTNVSLGKDITLSELESEYDAIFLGCGANSSKMMNIPGENLEGVYGGNELLENLVYPNYMNKKVAVIGGGNVSIDVARTVMQFNPQEVTLIYRKDKNDMPALEGEVKEALEEGVKFLFQTNVLQIMGNDKVEKILCVKTLKTDDNKVIDISDSQFYLDVDYVIMAVGSKTDDRLLNDLGLEVKSTGYLAVDDSNQTSEAKVFAAGDLVGTKSTVAWACRNGRDTAYSIIKYLEDGE